MKKSPYLFIVKAFRACLLFAFLLLLTLSFRIFIDSMVNKEFSVAFKMLLTSLTAFLAVYFLFLCPGGERIGFNRQISIGLLLIPIGFTLSFLLKDGYFINVVWMLFGLLFIVNPVWPKKYDYLGRKKCRKSTYTASLICIAIGLIFKFNI